MDTDNTPLILKYYELGVSINAQPIEVSINKEKSFFYKEVTAAPKEWHGWYAKYHEGIFIFFKDKQGQLFIGWNGQLVDTKNIIDIKWSSSLRASKFECFDINNISILKFKYETLRKFIFHPLDLLLELLIPDEWSYTLDLPGLIYCSFKEDSLENKFNSMCPNMLTLSVT